MAMASVKVRFYRGRAESAVRRVMNRRLAAAEYVLADRVRRNISRPSPPASAPGDFPHRDTGLLLQSVYSLHYRDSMTVRVANDAPYAADVERSRPYLHRSLQQASSRLRSILLRGKGVSASLDF